MFKPIPKIKNYFFLLILMLGSSFLYGQYNGCAGQRASFVDWHDGGYGSMTMNGVTYTVFCMDFDLDVPPSGHGYTIVSNYPTCGSAAAAISCVFGSCTDDDAGDCVWAATCSSDHSGTYGCSGSPGPGQGVLYGVPDDPSNQNFIFRVPTTPSCGCGLVIECSGQNPTCEGNDGWVSVSGSGNQGAVSFLWNTGETTYAIQNKGAGTYTVTVTDFGVGADCQEVCSYTLVDNYSGGAYFMTTAGIDPTSCGANDGQAGLTDGGGGTYPYTWTWSNGVVDTDGSDGVSISGLSAGTYTVTMSDALGCTLTSSSTINEPGGPTVSCSKTDPGCGASDGTATASASGGSGSYTYAWSGGGGSSATASNLAAGSYTVTVTDGGGCSAICDVTLASSDSPSATCSKTDPSCGGSDGSATVSASGGSGGYSYAWSGGGGSGATASGLTAGSYTVTVTDSNNCIATCDVTLTEAGGPSATCSKTDPSCGSSDGSATVSASGGSGGYTYAWSGGGGSSATASNLAAGSYTVTVSDGGGCTATCDVTLTEGGGPSATCSKTDPGCGLSNGSATVTASGGSGGYTYAWSGGGGSGATASNLAAGSYTVTVSDSGGCIATCDVTLSEPGGPSASCLVVSEPGCGLTNGSATVTASGGSGGYTYAWSGGGGSGATASNLGDGSYTVTVTDSNNCSATCDVTLSEPSSPLVDCDQVDPECFMMNGQASAIASGGTPPYTYAWGGDGSGTSSILSGLLAGTYTVTVTDANNCTATCTSVLPEPTGCCEITIISGVQSECMDNGTPTRIADDYFTMTFNAVNTSPVLLQYEVVLNANADGTGGTVLGTSNYNAAITVGTPNSPPFQADGSSTYALTIRDSTEPTCNQRYYTDGSPVESCFTCPVISQATASETSICDGEDIATIQVATQDVVSPLDQIQFVYFTAPQTGNNMYSGGTPIGGPVDATGGFATINNISFPSAGSYFVYAILAPAPVDDVTCRPTDFVEITVNPLPLINQNLTDDEICVDSTASILLMDSEVDVNYQLAIDLGAAALPVGGLVLGTGGTISFETDPMPAVGTYTFLVIATNNTTGCTRTITDRATVTVRRCDYPYYFRRCGDPPCHFIAGDLYLGTEINSGSDQGIMFPNNLRPGINARFPITIWNNTGSAAYLTGWIDWNADDDFDDPGEQIANEVYPYGTYNGTYLVSLPVAIPLDAERGSDVTARFRVSTNQTLIQNACGQPCAPDGEIEDYLLRIECNGDICLPYSATRE